MRQVIIFSDLNCSMCRKFLNFALKRDVQGVLWYAALQGKTGQEKLQGKELLLKEDTLIVLDGDEFLIRTRATLRLCSCFSGLWRVLGVISYLPPWCFFLPDCLYRIVAKNRYKLCSLAPVRLPSERMLP